MNLHLKHQAPTQLPSVLQSPATPACQPGTLQDSSLQLSLPSMQGYICCRTLTDNFYCIFFILFLNKRTQVLSVVWVSVLLKTLQSYKHNSAPSTQGIAASKRQLRKSHGHQQSGLSCWCHCSHQLCTLHRRSLYLQETTSRNPGLLRDCPSTALLLNSIHGLTGPDCPISQTDNLLWIIWCWLKPERLTAYWRECGPNGVFTCNSPCKKGKLPLIMLKQNSIFLFKTTYIQRHEFHVY